MSASNYSTFFGIKRIRFVVCITLLMISYAGKAQIFCPISEWSYQSPYNEQFDIAKIDEGLTIPITIQFQVGRETAIGKNWVFLPLDYYIVPTSETAVQVRDLKGLKIYLYRKYNSPEYKNTLHQNGKLFSYTMKEDSGKQLSMILCNKEWEMIYRKKRLHSLTFHNGIQLNYSVAGITSSEGRKLIECTYHHGKEKRLCRLRVENTSYIFEYDDQDRLSKILNTKRYPVLTFKYSDYNPEKLPSVILDIFKKNYRNFIVKKNNGINTKKMIKLAIEDTRAAKPDVLQTSVKSVQQTIKHPKEAKPVVSQIGTKLTQLTEKAPRAAKPDVLQASAKSVQLAEKKLKEAKPGVLRTTTKLTQILVENNVTGVKNEVIYDELSGFIVKNGGIYYAYDKSNKIFWTSHDGKKKEGMNFNEQSHVMTKIHMDGTKTETHQFTNNEKLNGLVRKIIEINRKGEKTLTYQAFYNDQGQLIREYKKDAQDTIYNYEKDIVTVKQNGRIISQYKVLPDGGKIILRTDNGIGEIKNKDGTTSKIKYINGNRTTESIYDESGRVQTVIYQDGRKEIFNYDKNGKMTGITVVDISL